MPKNPGNPPSIVKAQQQKVTNRKACYEVSNLAFKKTEERLFRRMQFATEVKEKREEQEMGGA